MIQIGGVYTTFCQEVGILLQKYRDRNGRCIAILFKSIGVRGRFDSPELPSTPVVQSYWAWSKDSAEFSGGARTRLYRSTGNYYILNSETIFSILLLVIGYSRITTSYLTSQHRGSAVCQELSALRALLHMVATWNWHFATTSPLVCLELWWVMSEAPDSPPWARVSLWNETIFNLIIM